MTTILKQRIDEFTLAPLLPHPLRKQGKEFLTRCPFHKDESPSLNINLDKQLYHCWGCGKGGSLRSLLTELSTKGGIEVPYSIPPDSYKELQQSETVHDTAVLALLEKIDPQRAEKIRRCGQEWYGAQCDFCETIGAYKWRCHDRLCPSCRSAVVAKWWSEHRVSSSLQTPSLLCLRMKAQQTSTPDELVALRKQGLEMLNTVKRQCHVNKGLYTITTDTNKGLTQLTYWLITDAELEAALSIFVAWGNIGGVCQLKDCVIDQGIHAVMDRFSWAIRNEISATNHFDLQDWITAIKGKKLIQGFGELYAITNRRHGKGYNMKNVVCRRCGGNHMNYLGKLHRPTIHQCGNGFTINYVTTPAPGKS